MLAQSLEPEAHDKALDNSRSNWNLEMLVFEERGKPEYSNGINDDLAGRYFEFISIRGRETNSQVIVSGVPFRCEKKGRLIEG